MLMKRLALLLSVLLPGLVACHGTKEFTIRTLPEGARVSINGKPVEGKTPVTTTIRQDKDLGIVVEKPGYQLASRTVYTQSSWWLSLLWTEHDPRAQYIEEDEVTIPLKRIPTAAEYKPTPLPPYTGGQTEGAKSVAPALRPLPEF